MDSVDEIRRHLDVALAGQYQLRHVLGRGGMGTVFLADDLRLGRPVAIKVLPPRLALDEHAVARFVREARTAARLDHPNIVPIFSVHHDEAMPYFVMKYVAGRSLQELIAEQPIPIPICQRILYDAAAALGHAHTRGVVHRDVKPSNIMLDESGRVLLADFGISKALEADTGGALTGTGQIIGTPAYMSPEQVTGQQLDGRSDQYSLAVVGHQLLTGQPLFGGGSANAALFQHVNEPPRSTRDLRSDVPDPLAAALLKALAKNPGERFASMETFADAVWPEHPSPASTSAGVSSFGARRRWSRSSTIAVAAGAAAAVAVAVLPSSDSASRGRGAAVQSGALDSLPKEAAAIPGAKNESRRNVPAGTTTQTTAPRAAATATQPDAAAVGYVTIDAVPYGTLSIDDVDVGDTPVVNRALAPGPHRFRVTRDGYKPWTETITITKGNTERRPIKLIPLQP